MDELDRLDVLGGAGPEDLDLQPMVVEVVELSSGSESADLPRGDGGAAMPISVVASPRPNAPLVDGPTDGLDLDRLTALGSRQQPQVRTKFKQRSAGLMRFARLHLERKRRAAERDRLQQKLAASDGQLQKISGLFPGVARATGIKRKRGDRGKKQQGIISLERATALARAAFETRQPRGLGVTFERLQAFTCELIVDLQKRGLLCFLYKCRYFRKSAPADKVHKVFLSYVHEGDTTQQELDTRRRFRRSADQPRSACRPRS